MQNIDRGYKNFSESANKTSMEVFDQTQHVSELCNLFSHRCQSNRRHISLPTQFCPK